MMMAQCDYNASEVVAKINGYTYVGNGDENQMVLINHHLHCSWSCISLTLLHTGQLRGQVGTHLSLSERSRWLGHLHWYPTDSTRKRCAVAGCNCSCVQVVSFQQASAIPRTSTTVCSQWGTTRLPTRPTGSSATHGARIGVHTSLSRCLVRASSTKLIPSSRHEGVPLPRVRQERLRRV